MSILTTQSSTRDTSQLYSRPSIARNSSLNYTSSQKLIALGLCFFAAASTYITMMEGSSFEGREVALGFLATNQKIFAVAALSLLLFSRGVTAQNTTSSSEFQVNSYTPSSQLYPDVATLRNGNFVAVWESYNQIYVNSIIFGQIFNQNGTRIGSEFQISGTRFNTRVTGLSDGGFIVIYGTAGSGVYARQFDDFGNLTNVEFQVNTNQTKFGGNPSITNTDDGGYIIAWESDGQDGDAAGIAAQRFNANNIKIGGEFQVNTYTIGDQTAPDIATLNGGGFVVVWESDGQDGNSLGIFGQIFQSNGSTLGTEFQLNTFATYSQTDPAVIGLENGNFMVTWRSEVQGGIYARICDPTGLPIGSEFPINTVTVGEQRSPSITKLTDGKIVTVWESSTADLHQIYIKGQIFFPNATLYESEFKVDSHSYEP